MSSLKVQLLLTGNELMSGDIVDSNSAMIAQNLKEIGLEVTRKVTVADDIDTLVSEIKHISQQADILIINGGLGPTIDDLTALALARATSVELTQHPLALEQIKRWCEKRGTTLNQPNLKQAMLPKNCDIVANSCGSAPGFSMTHQGCKIYCTPGVPHELKAMMAEHIKPDIAKSQPQHHSVDISKLQVFGIGESGLQTLIDEKLPHWPSDIELGFRAGKPLLEIKLTTRTAAAQKNKAHWLQALTSLLGQHCLGEVVDKPLSLAEHLLSNLQQHGVKVTTAESCTGGLIASMLTQVPGASQNFEAGFVTYSNAIKSSVINVPMATIEKHGAVSEEVVLAMAQGALTKSSADMAIAVSGVAGPDGGSAEKPVGTVWLAWGNKHTINTQCLLLPYERKRFQDYVANIAIDLLRRAVLDSPEIPHYITERNFQPSRQ